MQRISIEKRDSQQRDSQQPPQAPTLDQRNGADQLTYYVPLVDIVETNDAFLFQADLPGVRSEDVDIQFQNGVLTLSAKAQPRQPAQSRFLWREYGVGQFNRSFTIETPVDADNIRAELKHGVLSLYVPKAQAARARKVKIQSS